LIKESKPINHSQSKCGSAPEMHTQRTAKEHLKRTADSSSCYSVSGWMSIIHWNILTYLYVFVFPHKQFGLFDNFTSCRKSSWKVQPRCSHWNAWGRLEVFLYGCLHLFSFVWYHWVGLETHFISGFRFSLGPSVPTLHDCSVPFVPKSIKQQVFCCCGLSSL